MQAILDSLRGKDLMWWANIAVYVVSFIVLPTVGVLIRKAKGREKILGIAREAWIYVEAITKATPGALDDKLAEGLRMALVSAGADLDDKQRALVTAEFERLSAAEKNGKGSLALQPNGSVKIN